MNIVKCGLKPKKLKNIDVFVKNWRPVEGWLIEDKNNTFVLPINHSTLGQKFYDSYKTSVKRSFFYLLGAMLFVAVVFIFKPISNAAEHILFFSLLFTYAIFDMSLSISSIENCREKTEFLFDLNKSFIGLFVIFLPFFVLIGLVQFYSSEQLGSLESLVKTVGNYYPEIDITSIWRFFTGPLIHADTKHLTINAILTVIFASMMPLSRKTLIFVLFYMGAVGSHVVTFLIALLSNSSFDALLGGSGGAYALLAFTISFYFHKKYFYVAFSLVSFVLLTEFSINLFSSDTSFSAHSSGFTIGVITYFVVNIGRKSHWNSH